MTTNSDFTQFLLLSYMEVIVQFQLYFSQSNMQGLALYTMITIS